MYTEKIDCIVIGAGVIGLAIARKFALSGQTVFVLESEKHIGSGISSRNSEVIHAGIYYPPNSLKAKLCVKGKKQLYAYLTERNIPHKKCGKLLVATTAAQLETLEQIKKNATRNGVDDLQILSKKEAQNLEPELNCIGALFSPSTGIMDTHNYMLSLHGDITNHGGDVIFLTSVDSITPTEEGIELCISSNNEPTKIIAKTVINAAGLNAIPLAHKIDGMPKDQIPTAHYAKGNYFALNTPHNFSHLIYPVPEQAGLGVHLTLDLMNKARFGPDVEWIDQINYDVAPNRADSFYPAIRKYWPDLPDGALVSDYAGIRPKISLHNNEEIHTDFIIQEPKDHNIAGLINLFGIESPGLTASLAIADHIESIL